MRLGCSLPEVKPVQVLEECGYKVEAKRLAPVVTDTGAVGIMATQHYMFYAEVDESMRVTRGGGLE